MPLLSETGKLIKRGKQMGGRITEMFDYLNRDQMLSESERRLFYCSFSDGPEEKRIRRKIRNAWKKSAEYVRREK